VNITTSSVPVLTTTTVGSITTSTATSGGDISNDGGTPILSRGVVWSTSNNPTITLPTKTTDGSGSGNFSSTLTGLSLNTTYYVRAYATNANGTAYGNEVSFTTLNVDLVTGLVGYWPFNGNAIDESGNGNNGTVFGASLTSDRFGNAGKAYSFGGINDTIIVNLQNNNGDWSLNFWLYTPSNNNFGVQFPFGFGTQSINAFGLPGFGITGVNQQLPCTNLLSNRALFTDATTECNSAVWLNTLSINTWYNYSISKVGNFYSVHSQGDLVFTGTISNIILNKLKMGSRLSNFLEFNGKLDDIRIYNRALSQSEISYLATH
jgi:hypothetical protein